MPSWLRTAKKNNKLYLTKKKKKDSCSQKSALGNAEGIRPLAADVEGERCIEGDLELVLQTQEGKEI